MISITLPEGIKKIPDRAFLECTNFQSLAIPQSVTEFDNGGKCVGGCANLTNITVAADSKGGFSAEDGKIYYTDADGAWLLAWPAAAGEVIVSGVIGLLDGAFKHNDRITTITLAEGVTNIKGNDVFNSTSLTMLNLPASLTEYNRGIYNCPNLTTITVASGNAHFSVEDGNRLLYTADDGTKTLYAWPTAPAETTEPDGINTLKGTFWGNQTLTTVTLPESVTCIAQSAFADCPALQTINLEHVTTIEKEGFYGDTSLKSATLSAHIESLEHRAFRDCTALETVCIAAENPSTLYSPSSKTTPFQGCTALTHIEVPAASVAAYKAADGWSTLADKIVGYE